MARKQIICPQNATCTYCGDRGHNSSTCARSPPQQRNPPVSHPHPQQINPPVSHPHPQQINPPVSHPHPQQRNPPVSRPHPQQVNPPVFQSNDSDPLDDPPPSPSKFSNTKAWLSAKLVYLKRKHRRSENDVSEAEKNVKRQRAHGPDYWQTRAIVSQKSHAKIVLEKEIGAVEYASLDKGDAENFLKSAEGLMFLEQEKAEALMGQKFKAQATRVNPTNPESRQRRIFIELFTTSISGLSNSGDPVRFTGAGPRSSDLQSDFRENLIIESQARHEKGQYFWCPIACRWYHQSEMKAAHIFAYKHGQTMIEHIFGEEVAGELFSTRNGMFLSAQAEDRFDKGYLVLVPDLSEVSAEDWDKSSPREYKIKVLLPDGPGMDFVIDPPPFDTNRTWSDLDNQRVQFKSNYRPRARYLYFHYCLSVLRCSWFVKGDHWNRMQGELNKDCWATRGKYMKTEMLKAFVDELGHRAFAEQAKNHPSPPRKENNELSELALGKVVLDVALAHRERRMAEEREYE